MNAVNEIKTSLLILLQNGLQNSFDVNFLAKYCLKISKSYLCVKSEMINNIVLNDISSIDEIALDAVVGLFQKNVETGDFVIIRSFKNWKIPIITEQNAVFFIHKIVWNRTEQQLTKVYQQADPFFSKLLTSVKYIIKSRGFAKVTYFGQVLIVKQNYKLLNASIIDKVNFENIPPNLFDGKLDNQIFALLNYIENETEFSAAIPLNLFIHKAKLLKMNNFIDNGNNEILKDFDDELRIKKIVSESLEYINIKINNQYLATGKFTELEIINLKKCIKEYSIDLSNGGIDRSLFNYLHEVNMNITAEEFYSKYNTVIYYLISELKKTIAVKIKLV